MTAALLDGDIIAYRSLSAASDKTDWDGLGETSVVNMMSAKKNADTMIEEWRRGTGQRQVIVCLSPRDGGNFRKILSPGYKADRKDKPEGYWELIDYIEENYRVQRIEGLEADDVLGIMGTSEKMAGSVIVSIDKDLKTVPGLLFNPSKDPRPRKVSLYEANLFWMTQTLMGDRTDGYTGCPKIGEVKASAILADCSSLAEMWEAVVTTFASQKLDIDVALLNARMARILRREDYDKDKGKIRLWSPTNSPWVSISDPTMTASPVKASARKSSTASTEESATRPSSASTPPPPSRAKGKSRRSLPSTVM